MSKRTIFSMHLPSLVPVHRVTLKMFALLNVSLLPPTPAAPLGSPEENAPARMGTNMAMLMTIWWAHKECPSELPHTIIRDKTDTNINNNKIDYTFRNAQINIFCVFLLLSWRSGMMDYINSFHLHSYPLKKACSWVCPQLLIRADTRKWQQTNLCCCCCCVHCHKITRREKKQQIKKSVVV